MRVRSETDNASNSDGFQIPRYPYRLILTIFILLLYCITLSSSQHTYPISIIIWDLKGMNNEPKLPYGSNSKPNHEY